VSKAILLTFEGEKIGLSVSRHDLGGMLSIYLNEFSVIYELDHSSSARPKKNELMRH